MAPAHPDEMLQLPTAVVIGGGGFLGSLVCEKLLDLHVEVICADAGSEKNDHLQKLSRHPHFHFLDISSSTALSRVTRAHYVFHFLEPRLNSTGHHFANPLTGPQFTKNTLTLVEKFSAKYLLVLAASSRDSLPQVTNLAKFHRPTIQTENHYFLIEAQRLAQAQVASTLRHHHLDARCLWLLDVFGPNMDLTKEGPLPSLLHQVAHHQPLSVAGDGLHLLHPTYSTDSVEAVLKAMFSQGTSAKVFFIGSPEPISELNFSLLLRQKTSFPFDLAYTPTHLPRVTIPLELIKASQKELRWAPKVPIAAAIDQVIAWLENLTPSSPPPPTTPSLTSPTRLKPLKKPPFDHNGIQLRPQPEAALTPSPQPHSQMSPSRRRRVSLKTIFIAILVLLILSPFVSLITTLVLAAQSSQQAVTALSQADFNRAKIMSERASRELKFSQDTLTVIGPLASAVKLGDIVFRLEKLLNIGSNLSLATTHLSEGSAASIDAVEIILGSKTGDSFVSLSTAQGEVTRAYELLSLAESDLTASRPRLESMKLFGLKYYYQNLKEKVPQLRAHTETARSFLTAAPDIIGGGGEPKTYLVLLQNNAELRPTGGFIGSFALVSFESGRLLDFIVEDVYSADGQLKGYVEPPAPIKEHLGEATWYLRDVNWDPDFPTTARQAEWFLQKELGRSVDGTIAINLYVIQNLLQALGDLELEDYSETITADNLFTRAEYHSEVDFFPGSTQKKDFLSSLARELYHRLTRLEKTEALKVASALNRSIAESQLFVSFADPTFTSSSGELDWSGGVVNQIQCLHQPSCVTDYLGIFEANLGVNKANFFVDRRLNHQITIQRENRLVATTTISYVNQSVAETWPAGKYKNYLRLYVPEGSTLENITLNNQPLDETLITISAEHQKTVFGFPVTIPVQSEAVVTVQYTLPQKLALDPQNPLVEYTLFFQKQSGTANDPLAIDVSYPSYLKPVVAIPTTSMSNQLTKWETTNQKNGQFSLVFTK